MTINYSGNFFIALFRWKGSVWKAIWQELLIWLCIYFLLKIIVYIILRPIIPNDHYRTAVEVIALFQNYTTQLPVEFLLSFYVSQAVKRWWDQVVTLPWPDEMLGHICSVLYANDEETRHRRRASGRYVLVSIILALRNVSTSVADRYPNLESLVQLSLLTPEEKDLLDNHLGGTERQYELPLQWTHELIRVKTGATQGAVILALNSFRNQLRNLTYYNTTALPLVYTQTVTVMVYGYFMFMVIGKVIIMEQVDPWVPFNSILRFVFVVGWLKVAQDLAKPFGNDDDDVELTQWIDRHVRFVYTVTDYAVVNMPTPSTWTSDDITLKKLLEKFPVGERGENDDKSAPTFWGKIRSYFKSTVVTKF